MVRQVASKTSDIAGDGTTTATVLTASIIKKEGVKLVAAGMNPMDLKRGIDMAATAVVKDIERRAKKVQSSDEIAQVGTVSANGDKSIGKMSADAMKKVGNEGFRRPRPGAPEAVGRCPGTQDRRDRRLQGRPADAVACRLRQRP